MTGRRGWGDGTGWVTGETSHKAPRVRRRHRMIARGPHRKRFRDPFFSDVLGKTDPGTVFRRPRASQLRDGRCQNEMTSAVRKMVSSLSFRASMVPNTIFVPPVSSVRKYSSPVPGTPSGLISSA